MDHTYVFYINSIKAGKRSNISIFLDSVIIKCSPTHS